MLKKTKGLGNETPTNVVLYACLRIRHASLRNDAYGDTTGTVAKLKTFQSNLYLASQWLCGTLLNPQTVSQEKSSAPYFSLSLVEREFKLFWETGQEIYSFEQLDDENGNETIKWKPNSNGTAIEQKNDQEWLRSKSLENICSIFACCTLTMPEYARWFLAFSVRFSLRSLRNCWLIIYHFTIIIFVTWKNSNIILQWRKYIGRWQDFLFTS